MPIAANYNIAAIALSCLIAAACAPVSAPVVPQTTEARSCSDSSIHKPISFTVDGVMDGTREIPVTIFAPEKPGKYPLIAFSHGAFSAPERYEAMLKPMAAAGYITIAPTHIDSEILVTGEPPSQAQTWNTRNRDFAIALSVPEAVSTALSRRGISIDRGKTIAMGHSYGALIAQLAGGALAYNPDGSQTNRKNDAVKAVVGYSPPGPFPKFMDAKGWESLNIPSLTITGTTDILPGFADDWRVHKASFENASGSPRWLWVGDNIDHYFGGKFGRIKPASEASQRLFDRSLATVNGFLDISLDNPNACRLSGPMAGETIEKE